MAVIVGMQYTT